MAHFDRRHKETSKAGNHPSYYSSFDARQNESTVTNLIRQYSLSRLGHAELYSPSDFPESCDKGDYIAGSALVESELPDFTQQRV
jgi:hypothetical protein